MRRLALAATLVALGACNPPPMTDDAAPTASENAVRSPIVRMAAATKPVLIDGDPIHLVTTTTSPPPPTTASTVAPAPLTASVPSPGRCGGWGDLLAQHFGSESGKACSVMLCESGGNPTAENPRSTASGLFQFLDGTWARAREMVGAGQYARASHAPGAVQIAAAAAWLRATSWSQWECA